MLYCAMNYKCLLVGFLWVCENVCGCWIEFLFGFVAFFLFDGGVLL